MNSLGRRSPTMQRPVSSGRSYLSRLLPRPAWLLALTLGLASPASAQAPGTWAPTADLNQPRAEHTATLLASGTVLIAGGRDAADQPLASAEIYDPATGGYTLLASPLPAPVWGHTATRLDDGTVLIAGGQRGARYRRAAQLFDPASDTFAALTPMSTPRGRHTATLLRDGRVVVIGGTDGVGPLASLEIYDPTTRTFSLAPSALEGARQDHTATLLPDGRRAAGGERRGLRPGHGRVPARRLARHRAAALRRQLLRGAVYRHPAGHRRPRRRGDPARVLGGFLLSNLAQRQTHLRAGRDGHVNGGGLAAGRDGHHQHPRVQRRSRYEPHRDSGRCRCLHQQRISDQSQPIGCRRPFPRHRFGPAVPMDGAGGVYRREQDTRSVSRRYQQRQRQRLLRVDKWQH